MTDLDSGREAYRAGNHARALNLLLPLARAGDPEAQSLVGRTYLDDQYDNPCRSVSEGLYWLEQAEDRDGIRAAYELGMQFKYGHHDLRRDRARAAESFERARALAEPAAEAGSAEGQFVLGSMFWHGNGVRRNARRGLHWLRLAAEQGDIEHQVTLGEELWWRSDTIGSLEEALDWTIKAAEQGHAGAQYHLGASYAVGDEIGMDYRKAAKWYRRAGKQGSAEAIYNLGTMYLDGEGMKPVPAKGLELLDRAADLDFADAMTLLGTIHARGMSGQPADPITAARYYLRAFRAGSDSAPRDLAAEIIDGRISPEQVCVALLQFADEVGVVQAEEMLAALKRRD